MMLDNKASDLTDNLAPHKNMFEVNKPRALSSVARFPKPVASTIANWLHSKENNTPNSEQLQFMQTLVV